MKEFEALPERIRVLSISSRELVLPVAEALEAIDLLEAKGILILGWEGWVKDLNGQVGHRNAPQGTAGMDGLSLHGSAEFCRKTIRTDAELWRNKHPNGDEELFICITTGA